MKTIKMSLENVSSTLSRSEMKSILGGYGFSGCTAKCRGGSTVSCSGVACEAQDANWITGSDGYCNYWTNLAAPPQTTPCMYA